MSATPAKPPVPRPVPAKPAVPPRAPNVAVGSKPTGQPPAAPGGQLKTVISRFAPVYVAGWKGDQDTCTICRTLFSMPCVNCEAQELEEPCPVQEGICGHMFHMHCINRWLEQDRTCPFCHQPWVVK